MPEIFKMMKKVQGNRLFFGVFLFFAACQNLHIPFLETKKDQKEAPASSDTFAPGAFSPSCKPGEISVIEGNVLSVGMRMVSDGKWCALEMATDEGGKYPSFGVPVSPEHGKAYLYDGEDGVTYVAYQAEFGFEGTDRFRVFLLPEADKPRKNVEITVNVTAPESVIPAASVKRNAN
ncbi:hypothetical protein FAI41_01540 [Acetobacteraceae bacterium]|nr:hypothetical protein FAI41_01540 [Acetobacteraceae bacterium]